LPDPVPGGLRGRDMPEANPARGRQSEVLSRDRGLPAVLHHQRLNHESNRVIKHIKCVAVGLRNHGHYGKHIMLHSATTRQPEPDIGRGQPRFNASRLRATYI
jgi:hypothetical protein